MDIQLKQRLIGAAVLVALAVIFLPMLLQGPTPDGGAGHVPLEMPAAPDRKFETRELPLLPPAPGSATAPEQAGAPAAPTADPDDPNRIVTVNADDAPRPDALAGDPSTAPADLTARVVAPAMTTSSAPAPAPAASEPAAAQPAAPVAAPPIPAAQAGGDYAVNLGSYANTANADALVAALKAARLPAYGESLTLDGKAVRRVRVGPFADRAAAEAARHRVIAVRNDVPTAIVALDAEAAPPARAAAPPAVRSGYAVQVGAFRTQADADALRQRLRGGGFVAFSEQVRTDNGTLWRVRVGPEPDRTAAERLREQVAARFQLSGMVVSHP